MMRDIDPVLLSTESTKKLNELYEIHGQINKLNKDKVHHMLFDFLNKNYVFRTHNYNECVEAIEKHWNLFFSKTKEFLSLNTIYIDFNDFNNFPGYFGGIEYIDLDKNSHSYILQYLFFTFDKDYGEVKDYQFSLRKLILIGTNKKIIKKSNLQSGAFEIFEFFEDLGRLFLYTLQPRPKLFPEFGIFISFLEKFRLLEFLCLDQNPLGGSHILRIDDYSFRTPGYSRVESLASALYGYRNLKHLSLKKVGLDSRDVTALRITFDSLESLIDFSFTPEELDNNLAKSLRVSALIARERAELLGGLTGSEEKLSKTLKISEAFKYYIAPTSVPEEIKREEVEHREGYDSNFNLSSVQENKQEVKHEEYNAREVYDFTCDLVKVFLPEKPRLEFLQDKEDKHTPLKSFEGLQWRALIAKDKLDKLKSLVNESREELSLIKKVIEIWERFTVSDVFEQDLMPSSQEQKTTSNFPIVANLFKAWLKVCNAVYQNRCLMHGSTEKMPDYSEWPLELNFDQARWFHTYIHQSLIALWTASNAICSGLITVDKPLLKSEQVLQNLKNAGIHAVSAIPAVGELGRAIMYGIKTIHPAEHASIMGELKHVAGFAGSIGECLEDISALQHFLHGLKNFPNKLFEKITGRQWLNTNERINNLFLSFCGQDDFQGKIDGLISKFIHHFRGLIVNLTPQGAGQLGKACARHIAEGLMLGLFRGGDGIPLSLDQFILQTFRWLTYVPMESPPWLSLHGGARMSADVFLRSPGLLGCIDKRKIAFHFSRFKVNALADYSKYVGNISFFHQPDPERVGYRLADNAEIDLLNQQLQPEEKIDANNLNIFLGREMGKQIVHLIWKVDSQALAALKEEKISGVTADTKIWRSKEQRITLLEKDVSDLRGEVSQQIEVIQGYVQNVSNLLTKIDSLESKVNSFQSGSQSAEDSREAKTISIANNHSTVFARPQVIDPVKDSDNSEKKDQRKPHSQ